MRKAEKECCGHLWHSLGEGFFDIFNNDKELTTLTFSINNTRYTRNIARPDALDPEVAVPHVEHDAVALLEDLLHEAHQVAVGVAVAVDLGPVHVAFCVE